MRKPGFFRPHLRRRGASDTATPTLGWDQFWKRDPGGAFVPAQTGDDDPTSLAPTFVYIAGVVMTNQGQPPAGSQSCGWAQLQGGGLQDAIYAVPQFLPAGRIVRILTGCVGNPDAGSSCRLGVYAADSDTLYPTSLLHDSGELSYSSLGRKGAADVTFAVDAGLYYFVMHASTTSSGGITNTTPCLNEADLLPIMGRTVRWGNGEPVYNVSATIAWRHAQTYGALPATFPSSAPRRIVVSASSATRAVPAIYFGFDRD